MANEELDDLRSTLRALTISVKGGVQIDKLADDYKNVTGKIIPFKELGFKSLEAFLSSIPDVVCLQRGPNGRLFALGVADASTAHIASLISRQKSDTKKKSFRRPPTYAVRRAFSSRNAYRGSSRINSSHASSSSSSTSRNTYTRPMSPKRPPPSQTPKPSKPAAPAQHSKPPPRSEAVHPPRKYEVAPRFLRLQNQNRSPSPPLPAKEPVPSPSPPPSPRFPEPSFSRPVVPESSWNPIPPPKPCEPIMAPIQPARSLPNRPKPLENSVSAQMNSLSSTRSAKEYVSVYANLNDLDPRYTTIPCGQKAKNKGFVSTLYLGDNKYLSYPVVHSTKGAAEEEAAIKAKEDIQKRMKGRQQRYLNDSAHERRVCLLKDNTLVIRITR